jgi:hypothetical protein
MALHIADYLIVRDAQGDAANFLLPDERDIEGELRRLDVRTFRFRLPSLAAVEDTGILAYVLDGVPFGGEVDIEYEIAINEHTVQRHRIQSTMMRGLWGLVRSNWLLEAPDENVLEFREIERRSRGGTLNFSNLVLWFQRAVAAP